VPLGGAESLLEAVSFKKATESMGRGRVVNVRWERVTQFDMVTEMYYVRSARCKTVPLLQLSSLLLPRPRYIGGRGIVFDRFLCIFVCLFLC